MNKTAVIEVSYQGCKVGRLALLPNQRCGFEYNTSYLTTGTSISPFVLPLKKKLLVADADSLNGLFGVFVDSLGTPWECFIRLREIIEQGINPQSLTFLDHLSLIGSQGYGALEYAPGRRQEKPKPHPSIKEFAEQSREILLNRRDPIIDNRSIILQQIQPHITIHRDDGSWLVYSRSLNDPPQIGEIQYHFTTLAHRCGIIVPKHELFDNEYFGFRRIDRTEDGTKLHVLTAAALLNICPKQVSIDYITLLQATLSLTRNMEAVKEQFRRMVFNVIIANHNDHCGNFSFIRHKQEWLLSPAYNLIPCSENKGHTTTINGKRKPSQADLSVVGKAVCLNPKYIRDTIDEIITICSDQRAVGYPLPRR